MKTDFKVRTVIPCYSRYLLTSSQFSNLLGTVYRKGNLLFTPDGNSLLSPVGNRVSVFDLVQYVLSDHVLEGCADTVSAVILPIHSRLRTVPTSIASI